MRVLRGALRGLPPADARLLRWVLAATLTGFGCCTVSIILLFTWVSTGAEVHGLLTASHWLNRGAYACMVAVWACAVLLWWRNRRRAKDDGSTLAPRRGGPGKHRQVLPCAPPG
jgi:hypothetical protein